MSFAMLPKCIFDVTHDLTRSFQITHVRFNKFHVDIIKCYALHEIPLHVLSNDSSNTVLRCMLAVSIYNVIVRAHLTRTSALINSINKLYEAGFVVPHIAVIMLAKYIAPNSSYKMSEASIWPW